MNIDVSWAAWQHFEIGGHSCILNPILKKKYKKCNNFNTY